MKITCVSDLHGVYPELPGGDLLIVAGDLTGANKLAEYLRFNEWLIKQDYSRKVLIAGNHDGLLQNVGANWVPFTSPECVYLCDSGTEFEGFKIWGSPWTPKFFQWYFMKERGGEMRNVWDLIPDDTDILVTHGPPYGVLDKVQRYRSPEVHCGCEELAKAVKRVKPKLHVFGHIHAGYGQVKRNGTLFVNCSHMDEDYEAVNEPFTFELV